MPSTRRSYVQVVEGFFFLRPPSDTRYYQLGMSGPEPSINVASPSAGGEMHIPVHRLIQGPEPPSPAFTHASSVRAAAAMPYDHLPPLERALPYLVDTLYTELDSISNLLATRPPGSLSLGDVDVISHLIKVSSDFRECLQQSRCYTCPARSCAWSPTPSPPPAGFGETIYGTEQVSVIALDTRQEEPRLRPLDLHPSLAPLLPPHLQLDSHAAKAAIPSTVNEESNVYRKPRAGAWHTVVSRCAAIARGLFKFSSRSD